MAIMVIAGNGQRAVMDITGWSQREIDGVRLAVEVDGGSATVRTAR